jgi:hypothetical protein
MSVCYWYQIDICRCCNRIDKKFLIGKKYQNCSFIYTDKITTGLKVETHYHTLVILWDTSENVCQDLQNGC